MLDIQALGKVYPDGTVALADVSLRVGEGVLGLLGPNGAGKSTLMAILATLTRPTSGTFLWDGHDGLREPLRVRRQLGFLPQDFGVYGQLTAREFLRYLGRLKGLGVRQSRQRADVVTVPVSDENQAEFPIEVGDGVLEDVDEPDHCLPRLECSHVHDVRLSGGEWRLESIVRLGIGELAAPEADDMRLTLHEAADRAGIVLGRREDRRFRPSERGECGPLHRSLRGGPEVRVRERQNVVDERGVPHTALGPDEREVGIHHENTIDLP